MLQKLTPEEAAALEAAHTSRATSGASASAWNQVRLWASNETPCVHSRPLQYVKTRQQEGLGVDGLHQLAVQRHPAMLQWGSLSLVLASPWDCWAVGQACSELRATHAA
jgi:hypothetical protein